MQTFRNLAAVWRQLRTLDPRAAGWVILAGALGLAAGGGAGLLISPWAIAPMALLTGLLSALIVFNLRARRAMYGAIEGQLGAAAAILEQMREDEISHAQAGQSMGARELPLAVQRAMGIVSRVMTATAYRI